MLCSPYCSYELELLEFEPPDEEKERGLMTFEERLEAAERRRQDGNALFKGGQTAEALSKYRWAANSVVHSEGRLAGSCRGLRVHCKPLAACCRQQSSMFPTAASSLFALRPFLRLPPCQAGAVVHQ